MRRVLTNSTACASATAAATALSRPQQGNSGAQSPVTLSLGAAALRTSLRWYHGTQPTRQQLPVVKQQASDAESTLFAKAGFSLFVLCAPVTTTDATYALYCATSNKIFVFRADEVSSVTSFLVENIDGEKFVAGIVFPAESTNELASVMAELQKAGARAERRVVAGPDAWSLVYTSFKSQKEHVRSITLPTGFEHASFLISNAPFVPLNVPAVERSPLVPAPQEVLTVDYLTVHNTTLRRALVVWDAVVNVHRKFGLVGTKKAMSAQEMLVRRAVKAVNIFGVDLDNRLGSGSVVDGVTMVVTVFNAQTGTNTVHQIHNLAEETVKLNALTTLLYGEGTASITVLIPSPRTKQHQLTSFARLCKPKCPFFIVEPKEVGPYYQRNDAAFSFPGVNDPKQLFLKTVAACFPGSAKKDEETLSLRVRQTITHIAHKLFDARVGTAAKAFASSGIGTIPAPMAAEEDFAVSTAQRATDNPATPAAAVTATEKVVPGNERVFLNAVAQDADAAERLDQWYANIYENADRQAREEAVIACHQRFLVVDLETTTKKRYKRVANPFTGENHVVLSGALDYQGRIFMPSEYFSAEKAMKYDDPVVCKETRLVAGKSEASLFFPSLDEYDVIVGHNIKFDLLHVWRDAEVRRFLARGGKVWDTMYAEYLLTGHQVKLGRGAGLEDVAKSYGGQIPKLDLVKQAWAAGKETYEIPYDTLRAYLLGDLRNTELIFRKHLDRALVQRQAIIVAARMDSLLATTEMEYNGLKIDVPLAISQSNKLVGEAARKRQRMDAFIPPEVPRRLRKFFNWASNQMLICYFFGGKLKLVTANRLSKDLPGERVARHLIFSRPEDFPPSEYPSGVFLASPDLSSAQGDAVVVTTCGDAEKGTRVYTACVDNYMRECGLRKSSTIADSVSKLVVAVSRLQPEVRSEPDAVANLLPDRHVVLYAALQLDAAKQSTVVSLALRNAVTKETVEFTGLNTPSGAKALAAQLETFLRDQVARHTKALLMPSDHLDSSMSAAAFVDAQVLIVARDAPFTFRKLLVGISDEVRAYCEKRTDGQCSSSSSSAGIDELLQNLADRYTLSFVDATSTLLYYRHQYGDETSKLWSKGRPPSAEQASHLVMLPEYVPEPKGKQGVPMTAMLQKEVTEDASAWCRRYCEMFERIALKSLEREAEEELHPKKARKNSPPPKPDEALPLLLRRRPLLMRDWATLPADRASKLALLILFGRTVGTPHDAFSEPSAFDEEVEVTLKGKLLSKVSESQADSVIKKFRSPVTRQLQVGDESLTYFWKVHKDEVANTIMNLRADEKLIGTYYEHTEGGTGMVSLTHKVDSCIHHELIHNKTNTGRLASANPNCQNIPKEDKGELREMFVSRFHPHGKCIEVDYSQLEVITLAALSNDAQMIQDLINNVDFHCKRVTMIRPDLTYDEVVLRAKKNKEPEFVKLRQQAKIFSFQRQYGAGVAMLSASTGLSPDQVHQLIDREKEIYKGVDVFTNMVTLSANRFHASLQDGSRNIRGHQFYKGMFPVITGSRYIFTESDLPESFLRERPESAKSTNFSPTHLKNYPVQGFAGEIVQIMLGKLWRHFVATRNYDGNALLMNTVHDCVWVDAHESVYLQAAKDVERILSGAQAELNRLWPEMHCNVSFGVDVVAGENMCHLRPLPKPAKD